MTTKGLQVGNHLNHKEFGKVILEPQDFTDWNFEDVEGIPLTEEWLLKFGFNRNEPTKDFHYLEMPYYVKNSVMLFFNDSDKLSFLSGHGSIRDGKYFVSTFNWYTKSVHQLQNLYFALTGEELPIK